MSTGAVDPLHRLAGLYGIETAYTDAYGRHRQVPRDSLRALLVAMGVEPFGERQIGERLREVERRRAARLAEPVLVVSEQQATAIPVHLPDPATAGRITWQLTLETGESIEGASPADRLQAHACGDPTRRTLRLRRRLPVGEHRLDLGVGDHGEGALRARTQLIVAPERCFLPDDLDQDRLFGLSAQLYGLRSERDLGIGDFQDLAELCALGARNGASLIGINPLHALFPAEPRHFSPYSPSNRSFLNPLYIALDRMPELEESEPARALLADPAMQAAIEAVRREELVQYHAVWSLKARLLEALFETFRARHLQPGLETARGRGFLSFAREMGQPLFLQACFDTLHEMMLKEHGIWSWRDWPEGLRSPEGPEVGAFAAAHGERIVFFQWLQWVADDQLRAAQHRARAGGARVGLYRDLAVGVHPDGAAAWSFPGVTVAGVSVGAPPDQFNPRGQSWGLAPFSPVGLRRSAYRPLTLDLRQNMRHAGAVRIDHVMGLSRLFWIPAGASPAEGAYIRYPLDDLTRLIALASRRERCLVVGEDLGTVAPGFRETMHKAGVLSYRVLWFERGATGGVQPARRYPKRALITVSTHDLPTLAGFFVGRDLDWREQLDLYPERGAAEAARADRRQHSALLVQALRRAKLLPEDLDRDDPGFAEQLRVAAHAWLAATPSQLMMVQLEDLIGEVEQANLPGTTDEHPNWRRRLPLELAEFAALPALERLRQVMVAAGRSTL